MVKWYFYLNNREKENLYDNINEIKQKDVLVCKELKYRRYALFNSRYDLYKDIKDTEKSKKCYYEIITKHQSRIPFFDVDIDKDEISEFDEDFFFSEIKRIFNNLYSGKTLLVYTSHTSTKRSYHLLIRGVYLKDEIQSKAMFDEFISNIHKDYVKYFDGSIYSTIRQFRILGTHKYNKDNTKIFRDDLSINFKYTERSKLNEEAKKIYIFYLSLVTNINNCEYLKKFDGVVKEEKTLKPGNCDEGDVDKAMEILYKKLDKGRNFKFSSAMEKDGNYIITLKRSYPSYCQICKRTHENENPYLMLVGDSKGLYYNCRRTEGKNIFLDNLTDVYLLEDIIESNELEKDLEEIKNEEKDKEDKEDKKEDENITTIEIKDRVETREIREEKREEREEREEKEEKKREEKPKYKPQYLPSLRSDIMRYKKNKDEKKILKDVKKKMQEYEQLDMLKNYKF